MKTISEQCLRKLPVGKFVKFDTALDQDGHEHVVIAWSWMDHGMQHRISEFDIITGKYMGDTL